MVKRKRPIKRELEKKDFRVSIFGSARIKKGSRDYKLVHTLGRLLGEMGIDIVTGGGPGLMQAASSGHKSGNKDKKAHSIGLAIKLPKEQKQNKSLDIVREFQTFSNRLDNFMLLSNVVIVAPGGVGTLLELFYTWQLVQTKKICNIPIILLGNEWYGLIRWLEKFPLKNKYIDKHDMRLLFVAKDCPDALKMVQMAYKEYKSGNKKFCLNYTKYKLY